MVADYEIVVLNVEVIRGTELVISKNVKELRPVVRGTVLAHPLVVGYHVLVVEIYDEILVAMVTVVDYYLFVSVVQGTIAEHHEQHEKVVLKVH